MKDEYTLLNTPGGTHLDPCPCCGSNPRVRQYIDDNGDATQVVMCSFGDPIGPQNDELSNGCPLHSPSLEAYRTTVQEAVSYWNEFAKALLAIQRRNRYESPAAFRKLLEERDRFWRALHTISKYMPPRELETKSERVYGLRPDEATEYAYENVLNTAKGAIKGTRKPS